MCACLLLSPLYVRSAMCRHMHVLAQLMLIAECSCIRRGKTLLPMLNCRLGTREREHELRVFLRPPRCRGFVYDDVHALKVISRLEWLQRTSQHQHVLFWGMGGGCQTPDDEKLYTVVVPKKAYSHARCVYAILQLHFTYTHSRNNIRATMHWAIYNMHI